MRLREITRFFLVVPLVPRGLLLAFCAAAAIGGAMVGWNPRYAARALAPVLLLQLFAAASGFIVPARRGHYDLLLTNGANRVVVALIHWVMSALPGVLAWLTLAAVERAVGGAALTASGTLAALLLVSTVPWSLTVPLPRLSGGIAWLVLAIAASAMLGDDGPQVRELVPWGLVGLRIRPADIAAAVALAGLGLAIAALWIQKVDVPLESGQ